MTWLSFMFSAGGAEAPSPVAASAATVAAAVSRAVSAVLSILSPYNRCVVSGSNLAAFALASLILIVIPGPSVLFVITRGVVLGRRAALATVLGNCAGVYVQVAAVALGLGVVVERSAVVYDTVKLVGAAYLVWLGVRTFQRRRSLA